MREKVSFFPFLFVSLITFKKKKKKKKLKKKKKQKKKTKLTTLVFGLA